MKQLSVWLSLLASIILQTAVWAQADTVIKVHRVSAQEAVDLALKQRVEILNARLDVSNQKAVNDEIKGSALPQLSGTGSMVHFFNIPVTVLPDFLSPSIYKVLQDEGVKDGSGNPIQIPATIGTFPAQFGTPWQASLGISVSQLLFQPDVFVGLKARSAAIEVFENQVKVQEDSVKSNVLRSYYGVLIAKKGLGFAREAELRLSKLASDQGELFKNGFIERLDLDKTQVSLNNVRTNISQLKNLVDVGYAGLKFAMAIPQRDTLILSDTLSNEAITADILAGTSEFKYENRSEVKALESSNRLLEFQVKRYQLGALPTVGLAYNLSTSAQRNKFDFFEKERWFVSNYIGLNARFPIFDGGQRRNKVKQAGYALEKNRNTLNSFKQLVDFQLVAARNQLVNAISALNIQEDNKLLAEKVFNTTRIKYERGLGSSFELLQTETSLQESLNNYYQALYNAIVARISYNRALGQL